MVRMTSILAKVNITTLPCKASQPRFADFLATCTIPEEYRLTLLLYHQQCLQVTKHKRHLEQYFKRQLRPTPTLQLLVSIPGIGDITDAIIAMETGTVARFADDKHYASYCRLAPGARDSGGKRRHRSGSKDGNPYLKYAFTEAAIKAIRFYPEIRQFAAQLERRSNPVIARTVVAKELSKIAFYVLTRQQEFKTFKGIVIRKTRDWPRACLTGEHTASPLA
jgi:transposase